MIELKKFFKNLRKSLTNLLNYDRVVKLHGGNVSKKRMTQFERRNRELVGDISESEVISEVESVEEMPIKAINKTFDVIMNPDGKYDLVVIDYDLESGEASVVERKKIHNRTVALIFLNQKDALKTLTGTK